MLDVISKKFDLAAGAIAPAALSVECKDAWRLVVGSSQLIKITVIVRQENTQRNIEMFCSPNSIVDYFSCGFVTVQIENLGSEASAIEISLEPQPVESQYQIDSDTITVTNGQYVNLSPNDGYPPPFCNYISIYASGTCRVQMIDELDNIVWSTGSLNPSNQNILNELRVPARCRVQVRNNSVPTPVNFKGVWFKKL